MIVGEEIVAAVKAKRATALWTPVARGELGEQLRPFERGQVLSLQPRAGARGVRVTISEHPTLTSLGLLTPADARRQGYRGVQAARDAWVHLHGDDDEDSLVWALAIVLGDRSEFFTDHSERYLRAKMGGARAYTTDPSQAVHGEGAVPAADLELYAERARQARESEEQNRLMASLTTIKNAIAELDGCALSEEVKKDLAWMGRRAARIKHEIAA